MTSTLRAQLARSRQAKAGSKRIEVVLDAGQLLDLDVVKRTYGYNTSEAISFAISAARVIILRDSAKPVKD
jgi:hypothetical protein